MFPTLDSIFENTYTHDRENCNQLNEEIKRIKVVWKNSSTCERPKYSKHMFYEKWSCFNKNFSLSEQEESVLKLYQTTKGAAMINGYLRNSKQLTEEEIKQDIPQYISVIDNIFETKAKRTSESMYLIRGVSSVHRLKLNDTIENKSYISSTFKSSSAGFFTTLFDIPDWVHVQNPIWNNKHEQPTPDTIKYYTDLNEKKKNIISLITQKIHEGGVDFKSCCYLILKIPVDTPFIYMPMFTHDEEEILLPRNMGWKLLNMMVCNDTALFFVDTFSGDVN
jgi:hypothetical protein